MKQIFHIPYHLQMDKLQFLQGFWKSFVSLCKIIKNTNIKNYFVRGGGSGPLFGPLMKTALLWVQNLLTLSAKSTLVPLGLNSSSTSSRYKRNLLDPEPMDGESVVRKSKICILNEEMDDIMKTDKSKIKVFC